MASMAEVARLLSTPSPAADAGRRFDDLFNLVTDPAFLAVAWERVRTNRGARTAGVDGSTAYYIRSVRGEDVFLADLRAKEAGEILCVYEKDAQFLEFLEGLHLRPSTTVEVLKREYDETMTLRSNGKTMHLGKPATSRIWVRRLRA